MKTVYRDNCDPADSDYCTGCGHDLNISCNDCKALKEAIQEIHSAIGKYSSEINNKEEDDLRHNGLVAEEKVKEWKAHILRAHNQE